MVFSYAGTGRMPQFVAYEALGVISYSYTASVLNEFIKLDFGSIGLAYWVIADHANKLIQDYKDDQIINLTEDGGVVSQFDYGSILEVEAVAQDDWGLVTDTSNIETMGRTHFHSLTTWSVIKTWVGSGTVWEFGGSTYRLDAPWIGSGTLRVSSTANTHYVPAIATEGLLPLRSDTKIAYAPNWNVFGTLFSGSFAGEAVVKVFPEDPDYTRIAPIYVSAAELHSTYNPVYRATEFIPASGTGTGREGGFAIGPHVRFGTINDPDLDDGFSDERRVRYYDVDLTNVVRLHFHIIKGSGSNGGEQPDNGEDLLIEVHKADSNQSILTRISYGGNTSDHTLTTKTFNLEPNYTDYQTAGADIKVSQRNWTGTYQFDHYGLAGITFDTRVGVGDQRNDLFNVGGNASVSFRPNWVGSGVLFSFSTTDISRTFDYVGSGTLFGLSSLDEAVTWDYNNSSIDFFTYENFGSVAESPIDSITIQSIANDTIQSRANERIIDLVVSGSVSGAFLDFGTILTDGEQTPSTVGLDWGQILTNQTDYPFGLFPIGGTAKQVFTPNFIGSGVLFSFGEGIGRTKPRWIAYVQIGISGVAKTNFSLLHKGSGNLFSFNNGEDRRAYVYRGSGALYAISGASESVGADYPDSTALLPIAGVAGVSFTPNWNGTGVATLTGASVERQTDHYQGSGTLFNFETANEAVAYHYSSTSNAIFNYRNYGSVADTPINSITIQSIANETIESRKDERIIDLIVAGSSVGQFLDSGFILLNGEDSPETVREDYGSIMESISRYAMGDFLFEGEAASARTRTHIGTGSLFAFVEGRGRTKPRWIANIQIEVSGKGDTPRARSFVGEGVLFNLNNAEDRRAYAYNGSGALYAISGASESVGADYPDSTALLPLTGAARVSFTPNWNGSGIATLTGTLVERQTDHYKGSGTLFNFETADEAVAYHYSSTSNDIFEYRNYGSVADTPIESITIQSIANETIESRKDDRIIDLVESGSTSGSYLNYGFILLDGEDAPETVREDYGSIMESISRYAMGDFLVEGEAATSRTRTHIGSGDIKINVATIVSVPPKWTSDIFIDVTGEVADSVTKTFNGSGDLFNFVSSDERRAFGYQSTGTLYAVNGAAEVFGANPPDITTNLQVSGSASVAFVPNWNGSGDISIFGQLVERAAVNPPARGNLFGFSNADDRRTYSYNQSSTDLYVDVDYGFVASPVIDSWVIANHASKVIEDYKDDKLFDLVESGGGDFIDYGFIETANLAGLPGANNLPDATEDYGTIIDPQYERSIYPMGHLFKFSGLSGGVKVVINLRHIAVLTKPTLKLGGEAAIRLPNVHSGSGVLFNTGGAAESATFSPDDLTGLFDFVGFAATRRIPNFNGGGTIRLDGRASSAVAFAGFQENTIVLRGIAGQKYLPSYAGSGFISTLSGAAEAVTASPDDLFGLFDFVGTAAEKATAAYDGSGSLFGLSGAVEAVAVAEEKRNLIKVSGNAAERFIPNFNGSGSLSVLIGAAESRTASPDPFFTLFDFTGRGSVRATIAYSGFALLSVSGTTEPEILTFAEQPFGTATISGQGGERFVPSYVGFGRIAALSGAAESLTVNPLERQLLFSMGGVAGERFAAAPQVKGTEIKLQGEIATPLRTFAEQPFGVVPVSGIADERFVDVYGGFGTLFSGGFTSESITFKIPPVREGDILFRGSAVEATGFNPPDITTHIILSGEGVVPLRTFAEQPTVRIATRGTAVERQTDAYLGTGAIFSNGFTSESITKRLPEFTAHLNVTGLAEEKATFREIFFGSLFKFRGSAGRALLTFAEQPQTLSKISGVAATTRARDFIGDGNIATLSGAAEAATFNPLERDLLFDVTGIATERRTNSFVGTGQIRIYPEAADIRFTPNWNVEGVIPVSGTAVERVARDEVVRVLIGTFSGAAESVTFNPLEKDALFSFTGRATIASAVSEVKRVELALFAEPVTVHVVAVPPAGEGTATISGVGVERSARDYIGQIHIGTFSGAAESLTVNPLERQLLFSATGIATLRSTRAYVGTGSLFALNGAAESRAVAPPAEGLYDITGEANIVITLSHVGEGNLFSFVTSEEKVAYDYVGEQVLFTLSGEAVERIANAETFFGSIFSFSGAAERVAYVPSLLADVNIAGRAETPRSRVFTGSGDLYAFESAAESRTITYENVAIFDFLGQVKPAITKAYVGEAEIKTSGASTVAFVRAPYPGLAEVQLSGIADERTTANPPEEGTEIATDGEAKVLRSFGYEGSGQIKVNVDTIIGISLRIFGTGSINVRVHSRYFPLLQHRPDVHILITGSAATVKIDVAPARTYGWII